MIDAWNTRPTSDTQSRLDVAMEAIKEIAINSNHDWETVRKNPVKQIDAIHLLAVGVLYPER